MEFNNTTDPESNRTFMQNYYEGQVSNWVSAVSVMRSVCVPLIVGLGLFGNSVCVAVFLTKTMRTSSCSAFLVSLALVDVSFLICLLLTWIDSDISSIIRDDAACSALIFVTYISTFLNAWFIVGFTFDRFLAICIPLKHTILCNVFREKIVITILCCMACVMYSFSFWTTGLVQWGPRQRCSHKVEYFDFLSEVVWIDTFLTMLIPFCIIVCINSMVLRSVMKGIWAVKYAMSVNVRSRLININNHTRSRRHCANVTSIQRSVNQLRVAKTLFVVSLIFIFLNLPSHAIRLFSLIETKSNVMVSDEFYFFQEFTLMLYYTTFSCNFVLYTLFGRNFKTNLLLLLRCKSSSQDHRKKMLEKLTSTQGVCETPV